MFVSTINSKDFSYMYMYVQAPIHTHLPPTHTRNSPMAFLSYHPPWSIHCLTSSMGGWAPYTSSAGMFRSSIKNTCLFPRGGPNTPLRLAVHAVMIKYVKCIYKYYVFVYSIMINIFSESAI